MREFVRSVYNGGICALIALVVVIVACKDLSPKLPGDLQPVEACVLKDFQAGVTDPAQYLSDCAPAGEESLIAAIWDEIAFLLNSSQTPPAMKAALEPLVAAHRAELAAKKP